MKSSSHGAYPGSEDEQSRSSTPAAMPGSAYAALSATATMYSHQATPYTSTQYAVWDQQQQHLHMPTSTSAVPLDAYGRPLHGSSSPGPMSSGHSSLSSQWLATASPASSSSSSSQWPAAGQHPHAATFAPGAGPPQIRHQPQALYGSQLHVAGPDSSPGYGPAPDVGGSSDNGYIPIEYLSHQQQHQHQQYNHQLYPHQPHDSYQRPPSHPMQVPSQASQQQYYQHSWPGNNSAAMPSRGLERPLTGHAAALSKQIEEARRTCEHCGKTYSRRDVMLRHAAKAHPATPDSSSPDTPVGNSSGPHPGTLASRKSLDTIVNQMSAAMDEHFRTCEHCGKVYSRRDGVLRHIANAHPEVAVVQAGRGRSGSASGSIHGHGV